MARDIIQQSRFQGISYSEKEGVQSSFVFARSMDYRSDPTKLKILPKTAKQSGTVVTDLVLDTARKGTTSYFYGNGGNLYSRNSSNTWTNLRTVSGSTGNGLEYFGEDDYLYYPSDKYLGRYGPLAGTPTFVDDFIGSEGGVPLNTHSLDMEEDSSQYATAADHATISITGDLSLEIYTKFESLPAVGEQMVLAGKWNGSSDERSYKFDLAGIAGFFGDGSDSALTVSVNTTDAPIDSACTGTSGAVALSATNASFAANQEILIHQTRGTSPGVWERNTIQSYTAGTITTTNPLGNTYTSGAQVLVLKQYTNVTINTGITLTAKAWNGTVGGIVAFLANGTITVTGTITASSKGFIGGTARSGVDHGGYQGESSTAAGGSESTSANGTGGGGGGSGAGTGGGGGGAGGGHATVGTSGTAGVPSASGGTRGNSGGSADLTTMVFGGSGGSGGTDDNNSSGSSGAGGNSGGAIFIMGATTTITGSVVALGGAAGSATSTGHGGGGGGSGGSILVKAQTATLGSSLLAATAGSGGSGSGNGGAGGAGSTGRIHLDYNASYTGTTSPTLNVNQDDSLTTNSAFQLRLSVSSDGTAANSEALTKTLTSDPNLSQWYRYGVSWDASASTATFYVDGASVGTDIGTKTAIYDSTALFSIGAAFDGAGAAEDFLDGKADDIRLFNDIRTAAEFLSYKDTQIGQIANLQAYYKVNNSTADSSANSNTLTLVNAPVYDATDVPFSAATSRADLDQSNDDSGQGYTLTTAVNEGATHRQSFVPAKDPQKSIEVSITTIGTGNWTLAVHDALNREVASLTVVNGDLNTGDYEFVFSSSWRPVIGATYHFHLTSTVADGVALSGTASDLEDADFHTYFQVLVEDVYHPVLHFLSKLCIGNERYLATWDAITYAPHALTLPSGYRIRCLGTWKEYIAIGTWRGTNMTDYDQGRIFFWDGTSDTYNFYVDVPQGGINAMESGNPLYFVAGYSGDLMKFDGGKPYKVKRMPKIGTTTTLEIYPKALHMWRSLLHVGFCGTSTDTTIERGVYSWGRVDEQLPETLSFDHPISTGTTTDASLEIGMLYPIGSALFISWKQGTSYGVDSVALSNSPYSTARCEFLITDVGKIWREKQAATLRAYFKALSSGDTVQIEYKIDRNSAWTEATAESTANAIESRVSLPTKTNRFNEFQVAIELTTTNSTSPEFYGFGFEFDNLNRERRT